jgi:acetolactate synthase-1/2/3 large subunit
LREGDIAGIAMEKREITVAQLLVSVFAANGVKRIFGIPGGGSSLDVMQAAADSGIEFVLTRTESAAVMMAAATAELSGTPGVALTTKGPGVANAANGVAYAALDRAPVILLTDGFTSEQQSYVTHQVFDQQALLSPLTKGFARLGRGADANEIKAQIELAMTPPFGPVQIELTGDIARSSAVTTDINLSCAVASPAIDEAGVAAAAQLLKNATRPVVVVGLESREEGTAAQIRDFVAALNCPVLATYKAKGVISDFDAKNIGIFTGGAAEKECVSQADLIVLCGVDPVEFVLQPWRYNSPVIDIATQPHTPHYVSVDTTLVGSIGAHLSQLTQSCQRSDWTATEMHGLRERMLDSLQYPLGNGIGPQQVVELAEDDARHRGLNPRITVDAGAHMFSAMAFWRCNEPFDVLISNGLATMAFALPAAIAAALHQPERPVIAFTGDGGLLMCLGELLTAVQQRARIIVVVLNDGSLSLIDIKQQQRQMKPQGVRWDRPEFGATMTGFGGRAFQASNESQYRKAIGEALAEQGPVLIDVVIDPQGYTTQMTALRG